MKKIFLFLTLILLSLTGWSQKDAGHAPAASKADTSFRIFLYDPNHSYVIHAGDTAHTFSGRLDSLAKTLTRIGIGQVYTANGIVFGDGSTYGGIVNPGLTFDPTDSSFFAGSSAGTNISIIPSAGTLTLTSGNSTFMQLQLSDVNGQTYLSSPLPNNSVNANFTHFNKGDWQQSGYFYSAYTSGGSIWSALLVPYGCVVDMAYDRYFLGDSARGFLFLQDSTSAKLYSKNGTLSFISGSYTASLSNSGTFSLPNLSVTGSITTPYLAKTASYTAVTTDFLINFTSGTDTLFLPTAVGVTGKEYECKNSGASACLVKGFSSQTIDGSNTYALSTQYKYVWVKSNGANWIIIANN